MFRTREAIAVACVSVAFVAVVPSAVADWPGWGGPNGDFRVEARNLTDSWPEASSRTFSRKTTEAPSSHEAP